MGQLFTQSLVVVKYNRVFINPKISWTFYRYVYIFELCQEDRKLTVQGHSFNQVNPLTGKAERPLMA